MTLLKGAGILEIITPATVLAQYEKPIAEDIRRDMADRDFLDLCDAESQSSGQQRWTLSLAKLLEELQSEQAMRHLLGDFACEVGNQAAYTANDYIEHAEASSYLPCNDRPIAQVAFERASVYQEYALTGQACNQFREEGYGVGLEYRYADVPLAQGEAIIVRHAV